MRFGVENKALTAPLQLRACQAQPQIGSQLQRHVEAWEARPSIQLHPRDVMDRPVARGDHSDDLDEPNHAAVVVIKRATRGITAGHNGEAGAPQERLVVRVKWTIDEDRSRPVRLWSYRRAHWRSSRRRSPRPV